MWKGDEAHIGYFRYMCKGNDKDTPPVVVMSEGLKFLPDLLAEYHSDYYVHQSVGNKKRKIPDLSIEDECVQHCRKHAYRVHQKMDIALALVKIYREREKGWTDYELERKMNFVLAKLDDDDSFVNETAERLVRKLTR